MKTLKDVSRLDLHPRRYVVATDTPDNGRSTWAECWGANGMSGRAYFSSDHLGEAVGMMGRHSFVVDRHTGREVGRQRIAAKENE